MYDVQAFWIYNSYVKQWADGKLHESRVTITTTAQQNGQVSLKMRV